jgi:hypothetical protein
MEDPMEPTNRPYVDPATEPGDADTEPWADDRVDDKAGDPDETPTRRGSGRAVAGRCRDRGLTGGPVPD